MDYIDEKEVIKLAEACQTDLSALYHYLTDILPDDPPDITNDITEIQKALTNFVKNDLPMLTGA